MLRSFIGLFQIVFLILKHGVSECNGARFVFIPNLSSSFACINLIFIDPAHFNDVDYGALLRHENVHIRQYHWVDLILLEILSTIQWFNPFVYKMKTAVTELHEFLADKGAIGNDSPIEYQQLLISQVCGINTRSYASGFNGSLTKKRILMITNNRRNKRWFAAFAILIVAIVFTDALSRVNFAQQTQNKQEKKTSDSIVTTQPVQYFQQSNSEKVFITVTENSTFQGGDINTFRKWVDSHVKYPTNAVKNNISGKVTVKFVVNTSGKITTAEVLRGVSKDLDDEAIRVINSSPDWIPAMQDDHKVNQQYVLSVFFKTQK